MNDDFDDILRSRLRQSQPTPSSAAHSVLGQLQPAIRRARLRRTLAVGTATLSLLGISSVGIAAATMSLRQDPSEVDNLVEGDLLPEATSTTEPEARVEVFDDAKTVTPSTSLPAATSTLVENSDPATTDTAPSAPGQPAPVTTQSTSGNGGGNTPATINPPVTQPSAPPVTDPPSPPATTSATTAAPATTVATAPAPSGQRTIQSNCGSISVSYSGDSITLTGTQPAGGFAPDIKNSGPDEVEVGFSNGADECEIKARIDSGELRTDVDNHEDDDDDDDDNDDDDDDDSAGGDD